MGSVVSRSVVNLKKQFPAIGWVRADSAIDESSMREILKLKQECEELKTRLQQSKVNAPAGTENLAQGEDKLNITLKYTAETPKYTKYKITRSVTVTWNDLFAIIAPYMTIECEELTIRNAITEYVKTIISDELDDQKNQKKYIKFSGFDINKEEFQNIKVQFKALGYITKSVKNRSVKDTSNYWTLTEYGDFIITQLIAIRKE